MSLYMTPEEARKLVSALSLILCENTKCSIVLERGDGGGIGSTLFVGLADSKERTDITDYGAW